MLDDPRLRKPIQGGVDPQRADVLHVDDPVGNVGQCPVQEGEQDQALERRRIPRPPRHLSRGRWKLEQAEETLKIDESNRIDHEEAEEGHLHLPVLYITPRHARRQRPTCFSDAYDKSHYDTNYLFKLGKIDIPLYKILILLNLNLININCKT